MPTFIVVHGSVSGTTVGESVELTQDQADHINSSGKMLRGEDEEEEPRKRAKTATRVGLDGKPKTVEMQGTVIDSTADAEPIDDAPEAPAPKPAKKAAAKKKGG